jgi:hypothetical protein
VGNSSRSLPVAATTTKLNITLMQHLNLEIQPNVDGLLSLKKQTILVTLIRPLGSVKW